MNAREISTDLAPTAVGPYAQAFAAGSFVFCSGQIPLDPTTGKLVDSDAAAATEQVLVNLTSVLAAAGLTLRHVVKTTVFLADLDDFAAMNEVYTRYFGAHRPARACVEVSRLPKGARVEIDALACEE